jgi:DNA-binding transcriptional ArsR family regulator
MANENPNAAHRLDRDSLEKVAEMFRVFSEATRLAILQELKAGPMSVNELVEAVEGSQANVSKQLRTLYDAGLVTKAKSGTQVFYSVCDEVVYPLCELVCGKLNRDLTTKPEVFYQI